LCYPLQPHLYKGRIARIAHSVGNVQGWVTLLTVEFDEFDDVLGFLEAEGALSDFSGAQVDVVRDCPTGEGGMIGGVTVGGQVEIEEGFFIDSGDVAQVLDGFDLAHADHSFDFVELVFGEGERSSKLVDEGADEDVEVVEFLIFVHGGSP